MKLVTSILVLTLTGCGAYPHLAVPSPAYCRANGVSVPDGTPVTGQIVEYNFGRSMEVYARCQRVSARGCAIPVSENDWVIWVADYPGIDPLEQNRIRTHEECEALYAGGNGHTDGWMYD